MISVLFVCTGNICRSPTAEALFRHHVTQRGLVDSFTIDSAGTYGHHIGEEPDHRSQAVAKARGISMRGQAARKLSADDFNDFDLILALDQGHHAELEAVRPKHTQSQAEIAMFLEHHPKPQHKGSDVPDPYYGDFKGFEDVFNLIDEGAKALLDHLTEQL